MNPQEYYIGHGHTDMHARHSYITAHIFYEDLRKIQDSLPPADIYEKLTSNIDSDDLVNVNVVENSHFTFRASDSTNDTQTNKRE